MEKFSDLLLLVVGCFLGTILGRLVFDLVTNRFK
jgi:hypothetical protein